ncbi:MAG: hypothetical protein GX115_18275 [Ruminiclostridium sp.]|nr:hypothetical protein [Ruminiclostridium sp.]
MKRNLMGRLAFGLFITIMLVSQSCLIAFADVIWEPQTDFFKKHRDECTYVDGLKKIANGPGGSVTVWESPVSDREIDVIENGSQVYVNIHTKISQGMSGVFFQEAIKAVGYRWGIWLLSPELKGFLTSTEMKSRKVI